MHTLDTQDGQYHYEFKDRYASVCGDVQDSDSGVSEDNRSLAAYLSEAILPQHPRELINLFDSFSWVVSAI